MARDFSHLCIIIWFNGVRALDRLSFDVLTNDTYRIESFGDLRPRDIRRVIEYLKLLSVKSSSHPDNWIHLIQSTSLTDEHVSPLTSPYRPLQTHTQSHIASKDGVGSPVYAPAIHGTFGYKAVVDIKEAAFHDKRNAKRLRTKD